MKMKKGTLFQANARNLSGIQRTAVTCLVQLRLS